MVVLTRQEIVTPEKLVSNLMRYKRLQLVGVEEIERPFEISTTARACKATAAWATSMTLMM